MSDFWTWLHITGDAVEEAELSLIAEARRLADESGGGRVTTVAVGQGAEDALERLGHYGADAVVQIALPGLAGYNGERFAAALAALLQEHAPAALLMVHGLETADLAGRLGALAGSTVITRVVDAQVDDSGRLRAMRPIANGYLFESVEPAAPGTPLLTLLPAVLADPRRIWETPVEVQVKEPALDPVAGGARTIEVIAADPETLDIEEAEIVVAGGRGVGAGEAFELIHRLGRVLGGSVAGTRPVIDEHTLPFERQIGQTGKAVSPRLIINCGISGANEYTAGMEKSQLTIAVNSDARARIFRFADLGIVGDLHQVLPRLIQRLEQMAQQDEARDETE